MPFGYLMYFIQIMGGRGKRLGNPVFTISVCFIQTGSLYLPVIIDRQIDVMSAPYLCSCILRVITWWTSCNMSATVASGASVTHDRGTGFHLPTWIKPKQTHRDSEKTLGCSVSFLFLCKCGCCVHL